jgi:hypothetical protein
MFQKSNYRQRVTYWAPVPGDTGSGAELVAAPRIVRARWEDKRQQMLDSRGQQTVSKAEIYTEDDTIIELDGFLFNGITTETEPRNVEGAYQVIQVVRVPDLRNLHAENVAIV